MMDQKRLKQLRDLLKRRNHPDGFWLAPPGSTPHRNYLRWDELQELVDLAERDLRSGVIR
jgi:hypothetical protein